MTSLSVSQVSIATTIGRKMHIAHVSGHFISPANIALSMHTTIASFYESNKTNFEGQAFSLIQLNRATVATTTTVYSYDTVNTAAAIPNSEASLIARHKYTEIFTLYRKLTKKIISYCEAPIVVRSLTVRIYYCMFKGTT